MSGRKKRSGWGGARKGAGRKPAYMLSDNQLKAMLKSAKTRAKEEGKTIDDVLLDLIYNKKAYEVTSKQGSKSIVVDVDPKVQVIAIKIFKEFSMSKKTENESHIHTHAAPVIGLPPMADDPALTVIEGGKE